MVFICTLCSQRVALAGCGQKSHVTYMAPTPDPRVMSARAVMIVPCGRYTPRCPLDIYNNVCVTYPESTLLRKCHRGSMCVYTHWWPFVFIELAINMFIVLKSNKHFKV